MTELRFRARTRLPVAARAAFEWHLRPGAFERLNPPFAPARVLARSGPLGEGSRVTLEAPPFRSRWEIQHRDVVAGAGFRDVLLAGPFPRWDHAHRFEDEDGAGVLEDAIDCTLPFGVLGGLGAGYARRELERVFRYRHRVTVDDLAMHAAAAARGAPPLAIGLTGASGLVGGALAHLLTTGGHRVVRFVRRPARAPDEAQWDAARGVVDRARAEGLDAVVHLAGENIGGRRWDAAQRARVAASRGESSRALAASLASLERPPRAFVTASGAGLYGDRGDEPLDETSAPGTGFLADVARAWESAPEPLAARGVRVVVARFGMVLDPRAGALAKMLPPFLAGAGGPFGAGRQWTPWIALDDALGVLHHALTCEALAGPVNAVAPGAVTSAGFAAALGRVLGRPAVLPAPAIALRLLLGRDFADELLLASQRARPAVLEATGYRFRFASLEPALRHVLGRTRGASA